MNIYIKFKFKHMIVNVSLIVDMRVNIQIDINVIVDIALKNLLYSLQHGVPIQLFIFTMFKISGN